MGGRHQRASGRCPLRDPYLIPHADDAAADDVGAEAAAVDQPLLHLLVCQAGQVVAGLVEAEAAQHHLAGAELAADQVVQRDALRHDVATGLPRLDLRLVVALQRLDRLKLDERDLAAAARRAGPAAGGAEVAVAFESFAGDGAGLLDGDGRLAGDRGDVHGVDGAVVRHARAFLVLLRRGRPFDKLRAGSEGRPYTESMRSRAMRASRRVSSPNSTWLAIRPAARAS